MFENSQICLLHLLVSRESRIQKVQIKHTCRSNLSHSKYLPRSSRDLLPLYVLSFSDLCGFQSSSERWLTNGCVSKIKGIITLWVK